MREYIVRETECGLATKQEIVSDLVRCKDCKGWNPAHDDSSGWRCEKMSGLVNPHDDDYCSYAERKDDV